MHHRSIFYNLRKAKTRINGGSQCNELSENKIQAVKKFVLPIIKNDN